MDFCPNKMTPGSNFGALTFRNKLKAFLWRALKNSLACGENLRKRIPKAYLQCSSCNEEVESEVHLLALCPIVRQSWLPPPLGLRSEALTATSFTAWWGNFVSSRNNSSVNLSNLGNDKLHVLAALESQKPATFRRQGME